MLSGVFLYEFSSMPTCIVEEEKQPWPATLHLVKKTQEHALVLAACKPEDKAALCPSAEHMEAFARMADTRDRPAAASCPPAPECRCYAEGAFVQARGNKPFSSVFSDDFGGVFLKAS